MDSGIVNVSKGLRAVSGTWGILKVYVVVITRIIYSSRHRNRHPLPILTALFLSLGLLTSPQFLSKKARP